MFALACYLNEILNICCFGIIYSLICCLAVVFSCIDLDDLEEDPLGCIFQCIMGFFFLAGIFVALIQFFTLPFLWLWHIPGMLMLSIMPISAVLITAGMILQNNPRHVGNFFAGCGWLLIAVGGIVLIANSLISVVGCAWRFWFC